MRVTVTGRVSRVRRVFRRLRGPGRSLRRLAESPFILFGRGIWPVPRGPSRGLSLSSHWQARADSPSRKKVLKGSFFCLGPHFNLKTADPDAKYSPAQYNWGVLAKFNYYLASPFRGRARRPSRLRAAPRACPRSRGWGRPGGWLGGPAVGDSGPLHGPENMFKSPSCTRKRLPSGNSLLAPTTTPYINRRDCARCMPRVAPSALRAKAATLRGLAWSG